MSALPLIPSTSPTLAEAMRACLLRAGLSRFPGISAAVLGNPKAWLGTAYHKVLERLPEMAAAGQNAPAMLETFWNQEVDRLQQEAAAHPLNHRFGQPPFWRGYHLVLATVRLRATELMPSGGPGPPPATGAAPETFREEKFTAFSGKLNGKPDLGRGEDMIDFKTGSIYETEDIDAPPALKQAYVRQLQIYAYLAREAVGRWPRRGLLYPIAGPPVEVELEPAACVQEAEAAVELLDQYNATAQAQDPLALASPSPDACRWCPCKALCPAFWKAADESWAGTLDGETIGGRLAGPPQPVYGGSAVALHLSVDAGTVPHGSLTLSPLPIGVHTNIAGLEAGDRVRVVGVGRRRDNTLYPSLRTVVLSEAAIPRIEAAPVSGQTS